VFNKEIDEHEFGISMPDFIGWIGGQPITLKDGTKISAGFSGFRGISDIEIVLRALKAM
jgi:glc operon protein GlcG